MSHQGGSHGAQVPIDQLSQEALRGLIEEFVTRDGTDYGAVERNVDDKIEHVMRQLDAGDARIVFDPETQTANIVMTRDIPSGYATLRDRTPVPSASLGRRPVPSSVGKVRVESALAAREPSTRRRGVGVDEPNTGRGSADVGVGAEG